MSANNGAKSDELLEMLRLGRSAALSAAKAAEPEVYAAEDTAPAIDEDEAATVALEAEPARPQGFVLVQMRNNRGFELSKPETLLGCGPDCDVVIPQNPSDHSVSRKHCFIMLKYGKVYVRDVSLNGTFIGEPGCGRDGLTRLSQDIETEIRPGQVLCLADEFFTLIIRQER